VGSPVCRVPRADHGRTCCQCLQVQGRQAGASAGLTSGAYPQGGGLCSGAQGPLMPRRRGLWPVASEPDDVASPGARQGDSVHLPLLHSNHKPVLAGHAGRATWMLLPIIMCDPCSNTNSKGQIVLCHDDCVTGASQVASSAALQSRDQSRGPCKRVDESSAVLHRL
jgi:hypothetical protein